ncbi:MAG: hypothetical protein Ct9H300mP1_36170 [Planctomycetaceae bacterium]|nr:MAG: hypothetical protein Ct9H300mP1_36170 [Planctomycetaceae bacterium]
MIFEYKREHFEARDAPVGMTLDYDLVFYDQTKKRASPRLSPQTDAQAVIVKGKTPRGRTGRPDFPLSPKAGDQPVLQVLPRLPPPGAISG